MHPYEMRRTLDQRHKSERLDVKPGSLYNAVAWLLENEFIEIRGTESAGRRPARTIYGLLPAGEAQIKLWLNEMFGEIGREVSSFSVALDHLVYMSPEQALLMVENRLKALNDTIEAITSSMEDLVDRVGGINLIERDYELAVFRTQHSWLSQFAEQIRSERLRWDTEAILDAVRAQRRDRESKARTAQLT